MPDLRRLQDFLGRTQKHLQFAMDNGDEDGTNQYEGFMDRANALAERALGQGGQSQPMMADGPQDGTTPQKNSYSSNDFLNTPALNDPSGKLKIDLSQEVTDPFKKAVNPIQGAMDRYGAQPAGSQLNILKSLGQSQGQAEAPPFTSFMSNMFQGAPSPEQQRQANPMPEAPQFDPAAYGKSLMPDIGGTTKPGAAHTQWGYPVGDPLPSGSSPKLIPSAPTPKLDQAYEGQEPAVMPGKYESDPTFRNRIDSMGQIAGTKNYAKSPQELEFLDRVEREVGSKPSFFTLENIAMLLLMGAPRAYQNFQNDKKNYQQGVAGVAKGMRAETATQGAQAFRSQQNDLNRKVEERKAMATFLPHLAREKAAGAMAKVKALSGEIQRVQGQIPPPAENDPRILKLKQEIETALQEHDAIVNSVLKGGANQ